MAPDAVTRLFNYGMLKKRPRPPQKKPNDLTWAGTIKRFTAVMGHHTVALFQLEALGGSTEVVN
jgi:hypothetical protein